MGLDKYINGMYLSLWYHTEYGQYPKNPVFLQIHLSSHLNPWQPLIFFAVSIVLLFPVCHIVGNILYVTFYFGFSLL